MLTTILVEKFDGGFCQDSPSSVLPGKAHYLPASKPDSLDGRYKRPSRLFSCAMAIGQKEPMPQTSTSEARSGGSHSLPEPAGCSSIHQRRNEGPSCPCSTTAIPQSRTTTESVYKEPGLVRKTCS